MNRQNGKFANKIANLSKIVFKPRCMFSNHPIGPKLEGRDGWSRAMYQEPARQ
jgi:hypothetical protein